MTIVLNRKTFVGASEIRSHFWFQLFQKNDNANFMSSQTNHSKSKSNFAYRELFANAKKMVRTKKKQLEPNSNWILAGFPLKSYFLTGKAIKIKNKIKKKQFIDSVKIFFGQRAYSVSSSRRSAWGMTCFRDRTKRNEKKKRKRGKRNTFRYFFIWFIANASLKKIYKRINFATTHRRSKRKIQRKKKRI